ncbi:MAG TPA: hypothetical protein PKI01_04545 [Bacteroidales bacterium]|nr:hypothetical protein [Bacteroidales bacterium]
MKKLINISLAIFLILFCISCQPNKKGIIKDLLSSVNEFNKEEIAKVLDDNFTYVDKDGKSLNKNDYLKKIDSLKNYGYQEKIIEMQDFDSIVKTEEEITNIIDSILQVSPKEIQKKTYKFIDKKLKSIVVDTSLNYDKYQEAFDEKLSPFMYYVDDKYDLHDLSELSKDINKYLFEYSALPEPEKNLCKKYSKVQGTYVFDESVPHGVLCGLFLEFSFKKRHCNFIYFGLKMGGKYEVEDDYVYIEAGGELGNLTLKIIDRNTLKGESWACGTFRKKAKN